MAEKYGGYLLMFDEPKRAKLLKEHIARGDTFTDALSAPDWNPRTVELCLLCLDGLEINCVALALRGRRAATAKYQVRFSHFVELEPAISFDEIEIAIRQALKPYFLRVSSGEGERVPPATWSDLITAIHRLRPEASNDLERLQGLFQEFQQAFIGEAFEVMAQEKDAVGLALEISRFDRVELAEWKQPVDGSPASFVQGFPNVDLSQGSSKLRDDIPLAPFLEDLIACELREDKMIEHDAHVFGDWEEAKSPLQVGVVVFRRNNATLTVMNVNRMRIEGVLGVDLLYYHHGFQSYVMVQYKRMAQEGSKWVYRPDESLKDELDRMDKFQSAHLDPSLIGTQGYRLHSVPFYLKLCPTVTFEPFSTALIKGMYIPLDYWNILLASPEAKGELGGTRIVWDNESRHLCNTLFVQLVQDGWIGSGVSETKAISELIARSLRSGKSVNLAFYTED